MSLSIPEYIKAAGVDASPIRYEWKSSTRDDLLVDHPRLTDRMTGISYRGMLAFSLGSAEWVIWRLRPQLPDKIPFQVIEAAWAATIDWTYLKSLDVPDWAEDLPATIGGPLELTFWLLQRAFVQARRSEPFWQSSASLSELALHVVDKPETFKEWRRFVIDRLTRLHPKSKENRLGTPVPREALDPGFDYDPAAAPELLARFLRTLDYTQNPYLSSPEEMIAEGFKGTPYSL
jgi:hypothetical protein